MEYNRIMLKLHKNYRNVLFWLEHLNLTEQTHVLTIGNTDLDHIPKYVKHFTSVPKKNPIMNLYIPLQTKPLLYVNFILWCVKQKQIYKNESYWLNAICIIVYDKNWMKYLNDNSD